MAVVSAAATGELVPLKITCAKAHEATATKTNSIIRSVAGGIRNKCIFSRAHLGGWEVMPWWLSRFDFISSKTSCGVIIPMRRGSPSALREIVHHNRVPTTTFLRAACPRARVRSNFPREPLNRAVTAALPTCTSLCYGNAQNLRGRTAGSSCSPLSPRVMNTSRRTSAWIRRCRRKPLLPFTRTMSPLCKLSQAMASHKPSLHHESQGTY